MVSKQLHQTLVQSCREVALAQVGLQRVWQGAVGARERAGLQPERVGGFAARACEVLYAKLIKDADHLRCVCMCVRVRACVHVCVCARNRACVRARARFVKACAQIHSRLLKGRGPLLPFPDTPADFLCGTLGDRSSLDFNLMA